MPITSAHRVWKESPLGQRTSRGHLEVRFGSLKGLFRDISVLTLSEIGSMAGGWSVLRPMTFDYGSILSSRVTVPICCYDE